MCRCESTASFSQPTEVFEENIKWALDERSNPLEKETTNCRSAEGCESLVRNRRRSVKCLPVKLGLLGPERQGDTTDAAATAVKVPVGEARPLGISQYSTATEPEVEGSSGETGSSWTRADDTTRPDDATVAKAVGEARPPGIAEHSVATASAPAVSSGEAGSARPGKKNTPSAVDAAVAMPADEAPPPGIARAECHDET